jgi:Protein of unknown function (DUF4232)
MLAGAVVGVGLLAAACGSSGSQSSAPTTTATTTAPTTTAPRTTAPASTTTAAPTTTTAPTSTTTAASGASTTTSLAITGKGSCPSAALSVRLAAANGAAGSFYYTFEAHNLGSLSCQVGGYFGVSVWDPSGQIISSDDQRQPQSIEGATPHKVTLAPGGYASFDIRLTDVNCTASSPRIGAFHFIPPNDTTFAQVSTSRGYQYCGGGISVYPVEAGRHVPA